MINVNAIGVGKVRIVKGLHVPRMTAMDVENVYSE